MAVERTTYCNRDCPDACRIVATVDGGRVLRLQGDRAHPVTRGSLCQRTNQFLRLQYGPTRLTRPLIRKGGALEPATMEEALDLVASRLGLIVSESGPEAIFHYRSGGSLGMVVAAAGDLFFDMIGPVTKKRGDICSGAGEEAQILDFGLSDSSDLDDLHAARHVLVWGKNVFVSSPHTASVLERAKGAGTEIVLIDPVHHRTARLAHRFVQVRPAGDFALAMAVARVVFTRGWVDPEARNYCRDLSGFRALVESRSLAGWCAIADVDESVAEDLARRLHDGPTTILVGWGMARRRNGGTIVRALDALGAITGNVGRRGASVSYYFQRRRAFRSVGGRASRTIAEPLFGAGIMAADPPIRCVFIQAGNPVAMLPDSARVAEALRSRDFVVVIDPLMTDTCSLADVVLPTTTLLEADDLVGAYGHHHIGASRPVVPPPDGVMSELEIFQSLAARMNLGDALAGDIRAFKSRLISDEAAEAGVTLARLEDEIVRNPLAPRVAFESRRFLTEDGKAHLLTRAPQAAIPLDDPDYPLFLLSLSTPGSQSSQWSKGPPATLVVTLHPSAASGLPDGAAVMLESRLGRLAAILRHDASQRRDVAIVPKGGHYLAGTSANAITRAELTDIGEGGALYDERVRILPA